MEKRLLLVTGKPGIGKTTVLLKTIEDLKAKSYSVGGMVSREVRSGGMRVGFEVLDFNGGRKSLLAHVHQKQGPIVGKYRVNLDGLNDTGVHAIADAIERADVVVIDEIGPMELYSKEFIRVVQKAMESKKLVISTIHLMGRNPLIQQMKSREDAELYTVTHENRDKISKKIVKKAVEYLQERYRHGSLGGFNMRRSLYAGRRC